MKFLINSLAVFRLALLFSEEGGPWGMFRKLRGFLSRKAKAHEAVRKTEVHKGIKCIRCDSVWFGGFVAVLAHYGLGVAGEIFLMAMALSGAAILWNRL